MLRYRDDTTTCPIALWDVAQTGDADSICILRVHDDQVDAVTQHDDMADAAVSASMHA